MEATGSHPLFPAIVFVAICCIKSLLSDPSLNVSLNVKSAERRTIVKEQMKDFIIQTNNPMAVWSIRNHSKSDPGNSPSQRETTESSDPQPSAMKNQIKMRKKVVPREPQNLLYEDPSTWPFIDNGTCLFDPKDEPASDWLRRALVGVHLGTMKGGTHAVIEYLWQHPLVAKNANRRRAHELGYFTKKNFQRNASGIDRKVNQQHLAAVMSRSHPDLNNFKMYAVDATPRYLLWSDRIPAAILCVAPWAKLMASLRDPVDRVASQYRYDLHRDFDLAAWIDQDMKRLTEAGVLRNWTETDFNSFAGSDAEKLAWKTYLRNKNPMGLLARGLYAIQLEHYFEALERANRPRTDLLVFTAEELRRNTQTVYDRILRHLGLPPYQLPDTHPKHETESSLSKKIPDDLRVKLEEFYEPYNQRLYKLLNWGDVWSKRKTASAHLALQEIN